MTDISTASPVAVGIALTRCGENVSLQISTLFQSLHGLG